MNIKRLTITLALPFSILFAACGNKVNPALVEIKTKVKSVTDVAFGNIDFELNQKDFENAGFNYDDLMQFTIHDYDDAGNDLSFEAAFVKNYNEVGYFAPSLCNYGGTNESPAISFGIMPQKDDALSLVNKDVTIKMIEKQGYHRTRELVDVATKLTYEELGKDNLAYANFRDVTSVGTIAHYIESNKLYRGSSPFNNVGNPNERDYVADAYIGIENIESEISLADKDDAIEAYMDDIGVRHYGESNTERLYKETKEESKNSFFSVCLASDYYDTSDSDKDGGLVKKVFEYFATRYNDGHNSVYFHCNEGKDRTGFIAMVLEALMGCPLDDLVADAMLTFKNYYNVSIANNREKYNALADLLIYRQIYSILIDNPVDDLPKINWYEFNAKEAVEKIIHDSPISLKQKSRQYLRNVLRISAQDINAIETWLKPVEPEN